MAGHKNNHLIETARTLLLHMHVLVVFWDVVFLTSSHLINRMSSTILNGAIPHTLLFPHDHAYPIPPHVFGSTCFVHLLSLGHDKLSPLNQVCVFRLFSP